MYKMKLKNRADNLNALMKDILSSMKIHGFENSLHIENCISIAEDFAFHLQIPPDTSAKLKKLAQIHDIGNIRISNEILMKDPPLTEDDVNEIRQHSIIGFRIAKAIPDYSSIADLVLYHHERWDGSGYPSGLKAKEIPLECRIFGIIDTFEKLTGGTAYREAVSADAALQELKSLIGTAFEPLLVEDFIDFIEGHK